MLVPVLAHAHHMTAGTAVTGGVLAALVHTTAMIAVAAAIAFCVYQFLGLRILRSAWVNLDRVWAVALVGAGAATVVTALG
jgi:hypothetical protein